MNVVPDFLRRWFRAVNDTVYVNDQGDVAEAPTWAYVHVESIDGMSIARAVAMVFGLLQNHDDVVVRVNGVKHDNRLENLRVKPRKRKRTMNDLSDNRFKEFAYGGEL